MPFVLTLKKQYSNSPDKIGFCFTIRDHVILQDNIVLNCAPYKFIIKISLGNSVNYTVSYGGTKKVLLTMKKSHSKPLSVLCYSSVRTKKFY